MRFTPIDTSSKTWDSPTCPRNRSVNPSRLPLVKLVEWTSRSGTISLVTDLTQAYGEGGASFSLGRASVPCAARSLRECAQGIVLNRFATSQTLQRTHCLTSNTTQERIL